MKPVENKFEELSKFYLEPNGEFLDFDAQLQDMRFRTFREQLRGQSCLEIAPARGFTTQKLRKLFERLDVVEASKSLLDDIPDYENVQKFHGMIEDFESSSQYDTIVMDHILEHIENPVECLRHVKTLLAPRGLLIIGVPNAQSLHRQAAVKMGLLKTVYELNERDHALGHYRVYDFESFRHDVQLAGLRIVGEAGVFMKFLTNRQSQDILNPEQIHAYYLMGQDYPELSAEIFLYCEHPSDG